MPIQPTDPAGEALGYPYTTGELLSYAIRRVFEREREIAPDVLGTEQAEDMIASWTEALRGGAILGGRWDEVEAEGPPGRTRPWH